MHGHPGHIHPEIFRSAVFFEMQLAFGQRFGNIINSGLKECGSTTSRYETGTRSRQHNQESTKVLSPLQLRAKRMVSATLEGDGEAAEGDEATLTNVRQFQGNPFALGRALTTLLFSQQTASAEHELPVATPMTLMGEQPRPTWAVTSWRTMPKRARIVETPAESACYTRKPAP